MKTSLSQKDQIKAHLLSGKSITPLHALRLFDCMALSQRVTELRREGMKIETVMKPVGEKKHVAEYFISQ